MNNYIFLLRICFCLIFLLSANLSYAQEASTPVSVDDETIVDETPPVDDIPPEGIVYQTVLTTFPDGSVEATAGDAVVNDPTHPSQSLSDLQAQKKPDYVEHPLNAWNDSYKDCRLEMPTQYPNEQKRTNVEFVMPRHGLLSKAAEKQMIPKLKINVSEEEKVYGNHFGIDRTTIVYGVRKVRKVTLTEDDSVEEFIDFAVINSKTSQIGLMAQIGEVAAGAGANRNLAANAAKSCKLLGVSGTKTKAKTKKSSLVDLFYETVNQAADGVTGNNRKNVGLCEVVHLYCTVDEIKVPASWYLPGLPYGDSTIGYRSEPPGGADDPYYKERQDVLPNSIDAYLYTGGTERNNRALNNPPISVKATVYYTDINGLRQRISRFLTIKTFPPTLTNYRVSEFHSQYMPSGGITSHLKLGPGIFNFENVSVTNTRFTQASAGYFSDNGFTANLPQTATVAVAYQETGFGPPNCPAIQHLSDLYANGHLIVDFNHNIYQVYRTNPNINLEVDHSGVLFRSPRRILGVEELECSARPKYLIDTTIVSTADFKINYSGYAFWRWDFNLIFHEIDRDLNYQDPLETQNFLVYSDRKGGTETWDRDNRLSRNTIDTFDHEMNHAFVFEPKFRNRAERIYWEKAYQYNVQEHFFDINPW